MIKELEVIVSIANDPLWSSGGMEENVVVSLYPENRDVEKLAEDNGWTITCKQSRYSLYPMLGILMSWEYCVDNGVIGFKDFCGNSDFDSERCILKCLLTSAGVDVSSIVSYLSPLPMDYRFVLEYLVG
jgi:hypothetical protein